MKVPPDQTEVPPPLYLPMVKAAFCVMVLVYPAFTVMELQTAATLIVQSINPFPSKITSSDAVGIDAPPAPPEEVLQLPVLFQLTEVVPTQ
jgi:hypothetical protein